MVKNLSLFVGSLFALVLGAWCDAANATALALWNDPAQALAVVTPNGINVLPAWQYTAPTADGAGGAFVNGVEALTLDGQVVDVAVSGLASESAIAAAAATVAPAALFAAAAFAGLDLAAQGLSLTNGQVIASPAAGTPPNLFCKDGALAVWDQAFWDSQLAYYNQTTGWGATSTPWVEVGIAVDFPSAGTAAPIWQRGGNPATNVTGPSKPYTCSDNSPPGGGYAAPATSAPATPSQISTDVGKALSADPSAAPTFAQKLSDLGFPPSIVMQTPTGPASVKGPSSVTTSSSSGSSGSTSSTETCAPTDSLSYGPGSISVTRSTTCTTQTSGPSGASSSATTTTAPPSQSGSGAVTPFVPPSTSFPSSSSPTGTIALPPVSVPASSGTCPQPITFVVFGLTYSISLTPLCTLAGEIQPFVIGINGLAAALFILRGV